MQATSSSVAEAEKPFWAMINQKIVKWGEGGFPDGVPPAEKTALRQLHWEASFFFVESFKQQMTGTQGAL